MPASISSQANVFLYSDIYSGETFLQTKSGMRITSDSLSEAVKKNYTTSIFDKIKAFFFGNEQLKAKQALHDLIWAKDLGTALKAYTKLENMSGDGTKNNFYCLIHEDRNELAFKIYSPEDKIIPILDYIVKFDNTKDLNLTCSYMDKDSLSDEDLKTMANYKLDSTVTFYDQTPKGAERDFCGGVFKFFVNALNFGLGGATSRDGVYEGKERG